MSDLHKIQITGQLGKDPERHDTEQFKEAKASIGVKNSFKGSDAVEGCNNMVQHSLL
jgi:hypothetical protein